MRAGLVAVSLAPVAPLRHNGFMRHPETVTTSEISDFVFCAESWRLPQLGHKSANQTLQKEGTTHHVQKATTERVAGVSIAAGRTLIVLAILVRIGFVIFAR
jgi:hypothetical protein